MERKVQTAAAKAYNLTGIWRSHYHYPSSSRGDDFEGEHYVQLYRKGRQLILESLGGQNTSYLLMRLALDDTIATGSWQGETNPDGHYKGAIYYGTIQLVLDEDRKRMRGKWVGFGKNMVVNAGPWELTYIGQSAPEVTH
jgi:hypothetical protein